MYVPRPFVCAPPLYLFHGLYLLQFLHHVYLHSPDSKVRVLFAYTLKHVPLPLVSTTAALLGPSGVVHRVFFLCKIIAINNSLCACT